MATPLQLAKRYAGYFGKKEKTASEQLKYLHRAIVKIIIHLEKSVEVRPKKYRK
jgi:hypothetical protein